MVLKMRRVLIASTLAYLCVTAAAPASAGVAASDVAGRWHVDRIWMSTRANDCEAGKCGLTLDIVACGTGWCGIEVSDKNVCGATSLRFDSGKSETSGGMLFSGKLELARGTEPYVVEAYLRGAEGDAPAELSITGDTGGEFRVFRRSFPFHATLARAGSATCKLDKPVS